MKKEISNYKNKKGEKTKRNILESATRLFEKYDFTSVTVDAIVEAAGVSKGTFYIYFESKDELIANILSDYVTIVDSDYKNHLSSITPGTKADDIMLSLIAKISDVLVNTIGRDNMSLIYKLQLDKTFNTNSIKGYNRDLYQIISDVIQLGLNQGIFNTEIPLQTITNHFVMAIRGISYEWCIRYPNFDLKEEALLHFQLLLKGIQVEK